MTHIYFTQYIETSVVPVINFCQKFLCFLVVLFFKFPIKIFTTKYKQVYMVFICSLTMLKWITFIYIHRQAIFIAHASNSVHI